MKGDMEIEVLKDPSEAMSAAKARRREKLIVMSPEEQTRYCGDPAGATSTNDAPGYPCEDYGGFRQG
jgi:hypothetical protein